MKYVGVALHKQTITLCVVEAARKLLVRRRFSHQQTAEIVQFLSEQGDFELTVEATASYEWFVRLVEPRARRVDPEGTPAHPGKLRIIAESTRKSDQLDARVLAELLALNQILPAYRPTPRQRAHRRLVRQRAYLGRRITSGRNKVRHILADDNLDRKDLFTEVGQEYLAGWPWEAEDRFVVDQLTAEWTHRMQQRHALEKRLRTFAAQGSAQEQEDRRRLRTIPGVGEVTAEVLLAELAGPRRFTSAKPVVAYAGLAPGPRESAGKRRDLHIEKTGSPLLRWVLVPAAWQFVQRSPKWGRSHARREARVGRKKAIIALTRRLLCVAHSLLQHGEDDREFRAADLLPPPQRRTARTRSRKQELSL